MSTYNRIVVLGRLGQDPTISSTKGGTQLVEFTLATNHWNPETKKSDKTSWHRVVSFNEGCVKFAQYFKKGSQVLVEGEQINEVFEKDGQRRTYPKIYAMKFENFTPKAAGTDEAAGSGEQAPASAPAAAAPPAPATSGYTDIPF